MLFLAYFATGYSHTPILNVFQLGQPQNNHRLLRQYFPKEMRLNKASKEKVTAAAEAMNPRPRKYLGLQTFWEVFTRLTPSNLQFKTSGPLWVEFADTTLGPTGLFEPV